MPRRYWATLSPASARGCRDATILAAFAGSSEGFGGGVTVAISTLGGAGTCAGTDSGFVPLATGAAVGGGGGVACKAPTDRLGGVDGWVAIGSGWVAGAERPAVGLGATECEGAEGGRGSCGLPSAAGEGTATGEGKTGGLGNSAGGGVVSGLTVVIPPEGCGGIARLRGGICGAAPELLRLGDGGVPELGDDCVGAGPIEDGSVGDGEAKAVAAALGPLPFAPGAVRSVGGTKSRGLDAASLACGASGRLVAIPGVAFGGGDGAGSEEPVFIGEGSTSAVGAFPLEVVPYISGITGAVIPLGTLSEV